LLKLKKICKFRGSFIALELLFKGQTDLLSHSNPSSNQCSLEHPFWPEKVLLRQNFTTKKMVNSI
jgi:hypothetical protein